MKPGTSSDSAPSSDWVRGSRQFGEDMLTNRELPRQVDRAPFKVGGKYRHGQGRSGVSQRDVRAAAVRAPPENIYARPLVMSPPQLNKYYAIDSRPAPKKLGSRKYPPLCPAPGTYVMER